MSASAIRGIDIMPPKVLFSRGQIVDAAFHLLRTEGLDSITARRLADQLKCTVRPIYTHFSSMGSLRDETVLLAGQYTIDFLLKDHHEKPRLSLGIGYLRLAREEPEIFRAVYLTQNTGLDYESGRITPLLEKLRNDKDLHDLSEEALHRLNDRLWIYTHGLSTLLATGALQLPLTEAAAQLDEVGRELIRFELEQDKDQSR